MLYRSTYVSVLDILQVQEARHNHDEELVKKTVEEYDETLEWYVCSMFV